MHTLSNKELIESHAHVLSGGLQQKMHSADHNVVRQVAGLGLVVRLDSVGFDRLEVVVDVAMLIDVVHVGHLAHHLVHLLVFGCRFHAAQKVLFFCISCVAVGVSLMPVQKPCVVVDLG